MINLKSLIQPSRTIDVQYFYESGTWNKPDFAKSHSMVEIFLWGAGGGGRARRSNTPTNIGNGAGGGFRSLICSVESLGETESVIIGAGGLGGFTNSATTVAGNDGGDTEFAGVIAKGGQGAPFSTSAVARGGDDSHLSTPFGDFNVPVRQEPFRGLRVRSGGGGSEIAANQVSFIAGAAGGGGNHSTDTSGHGACLGFMRKNDRSILNPVYFGPGNGGFHNDSAEHTVIAGDGGRASGGGGARANANPGSSAKAGDGGDGIALIITYA